MSTSPTSTLYNGNHTRCTREASLALNPLAIYNGQWKALRTYSVDDTVKGRRSKLGGFLIYGVPLVLAALALPMRIHFSSDTLLAMLGILAGALISAFGQLASWRDSIKGTKRTDDANRPERWLLDSAASHILAGAYSSVCAAVLVLLSMVITLPNILPAWAHGIGTMAILLFSSHVATSILVALPALYSAYVQLNDVPGILNGNDWTE